MCPSNARRNTHATKRCARRNPQGCDPTAQSPDWRHHPPMSGSLHRPRSDAKRSAGWPVTGLAFSAALFLLLGCRSRGEPPEGLGITGPTGTGEEELEHFTLEGFPHQVDAYTIASATDAVIILHGGGGRNYGVAHSLGLNTQDAPPSESTIPWGWLQEHGLTVVFPQGQAVDAEPRAYTWDNRVMISGADDVSFLRALAEQVRDDYGARRVFLMGHSNGGMMANRIWCESPGTFDGYIGVSGPASAEYREQGSCQPSVAKPYFGLVGDSDRVLQITADNFEAETWEIRPTLVGVSEDAFQNPGLIGEYQQQSLRVSLGCDEVLADPEDSTASSSWSNCSGRFWLKRIRGGGHSISDLEEAGGVRIMATVADFIAQLE